MANSVGSSFLPVVLKDQYIVHPLIPLQVDDAGYIGPDHGGDFMNFKFVEATVVTGRLSDYLVRAHAVHQIVESFSAPLQFAFDAQLWIGVGHHAHRPTRFVRGRARTTNGEYFRRCGGFVSFTEWAEGLFANDSFEMKIRRPYRRGLSGDYPAACKGIFAHLRHLALPLINSIPDN